jgi:predicted nucleic acid-binding protein
LGLIQDLGPGPVALDTPVVIYYVEEHPRFLPAVAPVFEAVDGGRLSAIVTTLTLLEVLVVPYRTGQLDLAERYEALLTHSRGLEMVELDRVVFRGAAAVRALTGAKTPDALQLAAAASAGCSAVLTNDRRLPPFRNIRVLQASDYVEA